MKRLNGSLPMGYEHLARAGRDAGGRENAEVIAERTPGNRVRMLLMVLSKASVRMPRPRDEDSC
jgi:hypothetical protein